MAIPKSTATSGEAVDTLLALAEEEFSRGRDAATMAALAEAEALFPKRGPKEPAWRGRFVILNRTKAALAQRQDRQADAVAAFEAALSVIPRDKASRDSMAARLQLLVLLARSRLALGDAKTVLPEMQECEALMAALFGKIPPRAIETMRAAVLGNQGVANAILGDAEAADAKLTESLAAIDRLAAPELAEFRRQVAFALDKAIKERGGDPDVAHKQAPHAHHAHDESCGCSHAHDHHHDDNDHHTHRHADV
jgi:hypothetical protein